MINEIKFGNGTLAKVGGMQLEKLKISEKNPKSPSLHCLPQLTPGDIESWTRDPEGTEERSNISYAKMAM